MNYPWYETISNSNQLLQGDLIVRCPIIIPPNDINVDAEGVVQQQEQINVIVYNTVIMSQSCDLENGKIDNVLVCPYYTLGDFIDQLPAGDQIGRGRTKMLEALRRGNYGGYHLLNKDEDNGLPEFSIVDFKNVFSINYSFLQRHAEGLDARPRLLPPYREHMSQAFARFFMRVGLPMNVEGLE